MSNKKHTADYRVYYEDTDAVGIMYHANYISFCERGRSDLLRDLGLPASEVFEKLGIGFVIRHIDCDYLKMVKLDDLLTVETQVLSMKNTSFVMRQTISCQNSPVFKMDVSIVCVDRNGKPTRAPEGLREKFADYMIEE
ncbi:MAG: YbgC/FadM family acyl-CoA thioesterase [Alphaproteobacteria bacterium]|nr:YbgC/FadM family acyl-CoA thioesterase [Alphaproteobacteria bacterium]